MRRQRRKTSARRGARDLAPALALGALLLAGRPAIAEQADPFTSDPFDQDEQVESVPEEEAAARAEELAERGREAFDAHDLEGAARQLELAYRLGGDPSVLYYLALSLHGMGEYDAAEERLRRYMELVDLEPGQRYTLHLQLEGWRRQFSRVTITTVPVGATLLLGGQPLGSTPLPEPIVLPNGTYQLEARLAGYLPVQRELVVPGGRSVEVELALEEATAGQDARRRGLASAFWTTLGLALASGVALAVVGALTIRRADELDREDFPSPGQLESLGRLRGASYGLTAATGALSAASLVLGLLWALLSGGNHGEE